MPQLKDAYINSTGNDEEHALGLTVAVKDEGAGANGRIQPMLDLVDGEMDAVNRFILSKMASDVELIPTLAAHLIEAGGKRLRPMLTLAGAKLCGYQGDGHIALAAAVEFMHTATLLHDDVVDDSDTRRGRLAARKLWGNQASVLVGDYLLGQAFCMMVDVGSLRALQILSNAAAVIAEGEVMQLAAAKDITTSEASYLEIVGAKTAALFSAATEVGAAIAERPMSDQKKLANYGTNLGIAFQLVDDALDYAGNSKTLGKSVGDDFREGKITLPVILACRAGSSAQQAFWQRTLVDGTIETDDLETAVSYLHQHRAIEATIEQAAIYGERAQDALADFPNGPVKSAMLDVVDFCIARAY